MDRSVEGAPGEGQKWPLSFAQQSLWFIDQLEPGLATYNVVAAFRLSGPLDTAALRAAVELIAAQHPSLRSRFIEVDGDVWQTIDCRDDLTLTISDLRSVESLAREATLARAMLESTRRPFDLQNGPLCRFELYWLSATKWVLLLVVHHIVADEWSLKIIFRDLSANYTAALQGREIAATPKPSTSYTDYVVWQQNHVDVSSSSHHIAHWRQKLAGANVALDMITDLVRPPRQEHEGAALNFDLPRGLIDRLRVFARAKNSTLFMTLAAAFQVLLSRYSGQEDVVVGFPVANRSLEETSDTVGHFVNMLPLRTRLTDDVTFGNVLAQVRSELLDAYDHQEFPFAKLVEILHPVRDPSRHPVFQVLIDVIENSSHAFTLENVTVREMAVECPQAKFDLELTITNSGSESIGSFIYATRLYGRATIERLARNFVITLESILANPDIPVSLLRILSDEEQRLVQEWNASRDRPTMRFLPELVSDQARKSPKAIAVRFENEFQTYSQLESSSNSVAQFLRNKGIGRGAIVGIYADRWLQLPSVLLGVLKAGAAYLPLDPSFPDERLREIVSDSAPCLILTGPEYKTTFPASFQRVINCDEDVLCGSHDGEHVRLCADDPFFVIYTSGSSGKPKGAVNTHVGIANRLLWMREVLGIGPTDRFLQKTALTFDVSAVEMFAPLIAGGMVVLARSDGEKDTAYVREILAKEQITAAEFVPSLLAELLTDVERLPGSLRRVFCGGELLTPELCRKALAKFDGSLYNFYGPSEASIDSTYWLCDLTRADQRIPIGRPISNVQIYVLDRHRNPVPIGAPGEIYIGGIGIACGYLGRPELTEKHFLPDPFAGFGRMYKTGDRGCYLPDGMIQYLGRLDDQLKIRGLRVEPGEIDHVLRSHEAVLDAVTVFRDDPQELTAFVVLSKDVSDRDLRRFLARHLPLPMVPQAIVQVDRFPHLPNGKLDRRALSSMERPHREERLLIAPRSEIEEALASVWCETLQVEYISIEDDFFALGGHSLLAVRAIKRMRERLRIDVPLRALFENPTVEGLASFVELLKGSRRGEQLEGNGFHVERSEHLWFLNS